MSALSHHCRLPVLEGLSLLALLFSMVTGEMSSDCYLNQVAPNPTNKHQFFWCLPQGPTLWNCVDNQHQFDPLAKKCVPALKEEDSTKQLKGFKDKLLSFQEHYKNKVLQATGSLQKPSGKAPGSPTSPSQPLQESPPICPVALYGRSAQTILLSSTDHCSKFFYCSNGTPIPFECPPGLYFNSEEGVCDWAYRVKNCVNKRQSQSKTQSSTGSGGKAKPSRKSSPPLRLHNYTPNKFS